MVLWQRSDYPKAFTEDFGRQITFIDGKPQIKQTGIELLRANQAGIQVLDDRGGEIASYQRPADAKTSYSDAELLRLYRTGEFFGTTAFIGNLNDKGKEFSYILYSPVNVTKVTMFLNGDRFHYRQNNLYIGHRSTYHDPPCRRHYIWILDHK